MLLLRNAVLSRAQPVKPGQLLLPGGRVGHLCCRGAGAGRIDKGEQGVVPDALHQFQGIFKFLVGLAGESHNDVGGQNDIGHDGAGVIHQFQILRRRIAAVHLLEDPVIARLERQMDMAGDFGILGHGIKQLFCGVLGVAGHEPQQEFAGQLGQFRQQVREVHAAVEVLAVGVDVLAQQGDVPAAVFHQLLHLGNDILGLAAPLPAPDIGHDAVGTEVVAAIHDADPGFEGAGAHHRQTLGNGTSLVLRGKDPLPGVQDPVQQGGELPQVMGGKDAVHMDVALADFFRHGGLAHHAAAEENLLARMAALGVDQRAHVAQNPLLGVFPDGAGVDDNDVGPFLAVLHGVAALLQHTADAFGIGFVLLTAVGVHKGRGHNAGRFPALPDAAAEVLLLAQLFR